MADQTFTLLRLLAAIDAGETPVSTLADIATPDEVRGAIKCARNRGFVTLGTMATVTGAGYEWAHNLLSPCHQLAHPLSRVHGRKPAPGVAAS